MEVILNALSWAIASGPNMLAAVVGVLMALIGLFALIPGEQPEKALQSVVDFISMFSRK